MNQPAVAAPTDWREGRRLRAWELYHEGWQQRAIAKALGVSESAVSQWLTRAIAGGGPEALRHRRGGGPKPRLTAAQRGQLPGLLARGAESYGFRGELWTRKRVARVVQREFGVRYDPSHIGRLLQALDWSLQKPQQRATQRDEQAIQAWQDERWPEIKKKPTRSSEPSSG
jgi:transposase